MDASYHLVLISILFYPLPRGVCRKLQCDGVEVLQEQLKSVEIKQSEDAPRRGLDTPAASHIDSITSLAVTNAGQNFLLSGSRDGVVKVWK